MNKLPFFLLLILLLKLTISVESQNPALLKYVLQWPPTFCFHLNSEEEGRCKEPILEHQFTLHGLMPANEEGFNLECDPGEDPNWDEVFAPIYDELITFWPSLREDFNELELWKHEWRVHGVCGGTMPEEYFNTAIDINYLPEEGNLFNYLESSGIIPSDCEAYTKEQIFEAVQKVVDETHDPLYTKVLATSPAHRRTHAPNRRPPPPPPRRSPPPPPRRSPPPPPRRSPPPPPPRRSPPPPPPRRSPPPPPPRSPPPPPPSPPPPSPPPPSPSPPPPSPPPPSPSPPPPDIPLPPPSPPHNIYLSCIPINPDNTTHVYLSEVTLCTNLLGTEYISCPFEADPSSCPDEALIMLPLPQPQEPLDIWKTPVMERIAYI